MIFDLAQLYAEASYFDLAILTTDELHCSIRVVAAQITGLVEAIPM